MAEENTIRQDGVDEDKSTSIRIALSDDIMKKINVIAPLKGFDGKKPEIVSKIISLAINHYYKEVTVPELQSLTTNE
ncbi:hypothetical protein [Sulfurospirillum multivorans]|uniref:Uncharacterized protein n=2 Tax=Sulfurospirillum multivorans TaxID=66821 RepID=A0AA86ANT7_SULMK|nr:hypothetical protein [Sulfurospirillum multivorans]AHJ13027.1 hypothetical protein SMUL_1772 [Sulfurospirillum multivorans DSM 12446]QEH06518.1 hypothetical protein SMN_1753 [Sulfurospirillum multivorans]